MMIEAHPQTTGATLSPRGFADRRGRISLDLAEIGFWFGIIVPACAYALYPAAVILLSRLVPDGNGSPGDWPTVTVAIAAHNEERTIARAVRAVLAERYPGPATQVLVGLDGCTDGTADILRTFADQRLTVIEMPRSGKAATDNRLMASAHGEVVVKTDAGSEFRPGTLTRLVDPLRDTAVGCTTGVFRPRRDGSVPVEGERTYWGLEYRLMQAESRLGILALASGTALAVRRSLFRPIPPDSDADVTVAPEVALLGGRVTYVPEAIVYDDGPSTLRSVLRNRRRMALRALPATLRIIPRLAHGGRVGAAIGLTFHKVFRWLTPVALIVWTVSASALVLRGDPFYRPFVIFLIVAAATIAALALLRPASRSAAGGLVVAQLAFLLATIDALRGRRMRAWSRGPE